MEPRGRSAVSTARKPPRPALMMPSKTVLHILVDSREKSIPPFPDGVTWERRMLEEGDYATEPLLALARIERKSSSDFAGTITRGRERFERELDRLRSFRHRLILVEGNMAEQLAFGTVSQTNPDSILGSIASFYARWDCPVIFAHDQRGCGRLIAGILRRLEERYSR